MSVTLPHDRELLALVEMVFDAHGDSEYLGVMVTDTHEHVRYLTGKLRDATTWDKGQVRIFREGVEVKGGGRVIVVSANYPERLMGIKPTKVLVMGRLGELFYHLRTFDSVEAVG